MAGIRDKPPASDPKAVRQAFLRALNDGNVSAVKPPPAAAGKPETGLRADAQWLRRQVRPEDGSLAAQADRMAGALHTLRSELDHTGSDAPSRAQYRALVAGLKTPDGAGTAKAPGLTGAGSGAAPAAVGSKAPPPLPEAAAKKPLGERLLRALGARGALKGVLSQNRSAPDAGKRVSRTRQDATHGGTAPAAAPPPPPDPLLQVGTVLRARVRAQIAQAQDDPVADNLRGALAAMLLFEAPDGEGVCDLRHQLLQADMLAEPLNPQHLWNTLTDFVRYNPPVSGFDYAIFENAPVLYTAFWGQSTRAPTLAKFFAQVCAAQFSEDEFLPGDPKLEAADRLCETNDACLAYFAEGKRSVRLVVLSAAGATRNLLARADKARERWKSGKH